jgi:hypothetical protein
MTEHPITPPPELVEQWAHEAGKGWRGNGTYEQDITNQAARWGADMELEACCEYMQHEDFHGFAKELHAARRPKPPSLKEQALEVVTGLEKRWDLQCDLTLLRRALEQLDD